MLHFYHVKCQRYSLPNCTPGRHASKVPISLATSLIETVSLDIILLMRLRTLTLNRPGLGGIRPQAGSSLCCAETVSSRKLKLSDFYYILIGLNSEYKPGPWDIHCCHGNAIVEGCSVKCWLKSVENCISLLKSFYNLSLGLRFVISILKLPPIPNFKQIGLKTKKLGLSTFFS